MNFRLVWVGSDNEGDGDEAALEERTAESAAGRSGGARYECRGGEMVRWEQRDSGRRKSIPVANFTARIVRDLILDDDAEPTRRFALEARCGAERFAFVVTAAEFGRMSWVLDQLGPGAIIYPGQLQHARAAIQYVSGSIRQQRIFTHTGWRKSGTDWVYLDAGGAIGAAQSPCDMQVELPAALAHYQLRPPPIARLELLLFERACNFWTSPRTGSVARYWPQCTEPRWARWISVCS